MLRAGFEHVRVQSHGYGELVKSDPPPPPRPKGSSDGPTAQDAAFNPRKYMAELPRLFAFLRSELGEVRPLITPAARALAPGHPRSQRWLDIQGLQQSGLACAKLSRSFAHRRSNCCTMCTSG